MKGIENIHFCDDVTLFCDDVTEQVKNLVVWGLTVYHTGILVLLTSNPPVTGACFIESRLIYKRDKLRTNW